MTNQVTMIRRTLNPDGILELEARPDLPAGPVEVIIRAIRHPSLLTESEWEFLQRSRAELQAAGSPFMTEKEVQEHVEDLRSGDERLDALYRQIEDERRVVDHVDRP